MNSDKRFNNDKWTESLRQRMDNYSEPLPVGLWEEIEAEMSEFDIRTDSETFLKKEVLPDSAENPNPKVISIWRKWQSIAAAAAVMLAVSSISVWYWLHESDSVNEMILANETIKDNDNLLMSANTDIKKVAALNEGVISDDASVEGNYSRLSGKTADVVSSRADSYNTDVNLQMAEVYSSDSLNDEGFAKHAIENQREHDDESYAVSDDTNSDSKKKKRIDMMKADRETVKRNSYLAMSGSKGRNRDSHNGFEIGLSAGNIPYSASENFSGLSRLASTRALPQTNDVVISEVAGGSASYSQVLFNNRDQKATTDVKHDMPVTVGASVKWNWNDKWALESGLTYTMLSSELHSGGKSYMEEKQKLHYIGIPLKVHRSVWNNKMFSFYASAGGMMEKCVSGTLETVYVTGNTEKSKENTDLDIKPLQWSVMASVGAQVNFCRIASIYIEPGVAYYFDDNSGVMTIRKDHPLNFNLQLGLRFNLNK